MAADRPDDSWNEGAPYERYVGRWSRRVAAEFLEWLAPPPSLRWLDVGCGTGALTEAIAERCSPAELVGVDPSAGFVTTARGRLGERAGFHVGDALALPVPAASADVVVSGLVLNFVPDAAAALREMRRVTRESGTIAAYVWDYAARMELMRHFWDAAVALFPRARDLDEGVRFPLCAPAALERAFRAAELGGIEVAPIDVETRFRDFDDYWNPFLGAQGPAPAFAMSLDPESRERLRERIRERLPIQPDGTIALVARAWAVRGRMPGNSSRHSV